MIRTLELKLIPTGLLEPHPDALAFPTDADDRAALGASLHDQEQIQPLIVQAAPSGRYLIIDGLGRWEAAKAEARPSCECKVVSCDDPRAIVLASNGAGRKRSTGTRVMCYLLAHQTAVIQAAAAVASQQKRGGGSHVTTPPLNDIPADLLPFTARSISKLLGVSQKDVQAATDLLICQTEGVTPDNVSFDSGSPSEKSLTEAFNAVMSGRLPVRRWKPAFGGSSSTAGAAKAPVNHADLGVRSLKSIRTVFEGWQQVSMIDRDTLLNLLDQVLDAAPEDVAALLSRRYAQPATAGRKSK